MPDVTIELDFDDETWSDLDVLNDNALEEEDDDVIISDPIQLSEVIFNLPGSVRIRNLSSELRNLIATNLDVPGIVSIGTWDMVVKFLTANESFDGDLTKPIKKDVWKPFKNLHAQILVNALYKVERIDILAKWKSMVEDNCYLEETEATTETSGFFNTTDTIAFPAVAPLQPFNLNNKILVLHYETNKNERKSFRWFWDNLTEHLAKEGKGELEAVDVAQIEKNDRGNIVQLMDDAYPRFKHIVVCFNNSYVEALVEPMPENKFRFRKEIHGRTSAEFTNNGNRNLRFRCVQMPDLTRQVETHWAIVTIQYKWPKEHKELMMRLLRKDGTRTAVTGEFPELYPANQLMTM